LIIPFVIRNSKDFRYSPSLIEPSDHHFALFFTHSGMEEESANTLVKKTITNNGIVVINKTVLLVGIFRIKWYHFCTNPQDIFIQNFSKGNYIFLKLSR
jgi:hypothetical protein